jgi:hypothetical protein
LNSSDRRAERFELPGTHGLIFPWAPPVGLDLQVWLDLETALKDELKKVVEKRVSLEVEAGGLRSPQSSPPSSDEGEPSVQNYSITRFRLPPMETE